MITDWSNRRGYRLKSGIRRLLKFRDPEALVLFPGETMLQGRNSWNGKVLAPYVRYAEGFLHDVAHLLVSSNQRLAEPNFGLGADPAEEGWIVKSRRTVSAEFAQYEEDMTCKLQLALCALLDCNAHSIMEEAEELRCKFPTEKDLLVVQKYRPEALSPENWVKLEAARLRVSKKIEKEFTNVV